MRPPAPVSSTPSISNLTLSFPVPKTSPFKTRLQNSPVAQINGITPATKTARSCLRTSGSKVCGIVVAPGASPSSPVARAERFSQSDAALEIKPPTTKRVLLLDSLLLPDPVLVRVDDLFPSAFWRVTAGVWHTIPTLFAPFRSMVVILLLSPYLCRAERRERRPGVTLCDLCFL